MPSARHLILVDDDPHVLHALRFAFETEGYRVRTHGRGEELLANLPMEPATCLVIDERLPGMSGLETVSQLRAKGVVAPAILITTHPTPQTIRRAAAARVQIVEKPLMDDSLANAIRAVLDATIDSVRAEKK